MKQELVDQYYKNLQKFQDGDWTSDMWYIYCVSILEQLMEENKEVFVRLKNR